MDEHARTRCPHAMDVDIAEVTKLCDKLGDVDPRPAVDLGWILPSHHRHPHGDDGSQKSGPWRQQDCFYLEDAKYLD